MRANSTINLLLQVLGPRGSRPVRGTVTLMVAAAIAEGLSYALLPPVLRSLLGSDPSNVWPRIIVFGAAVTLYAALRFAADMRGFRVGTHLLAHLYDRLGTHLARLPVGWFTPRRVGDVSVLAGTGILQVGGAITHLMGPLVSATVTPLTIVIVLVVTNWQMGLGALMAVPLVAMVHYVSARLMDRADVERSDHDEEAASRLIEFVHLQPVLRTSGRAAEGLRLLDDALMGVQRHSRRSTAAAVPGVLGLGLTVQAAFIALLILGTHLALVGRIDAPEALALLVLSARCAAPLLSLSDLGGQVHATRAILDRLAALLRTPPLPEPHQPVRPHRHDLQIDSISFDQNGRTIIDGLSLSVPQGTKLALVGASGAGKSTLLQLLARFHDVDDGHVRWGGVDVRDIDSPALRSSVSVVFQDVYLVEGTIEDNVRLGRPDASSEDVTAAAAAAGLDELIRRLPEGWSTPVGEGGRLLSGGERQRISIARALLKNAPVVLLDEVASALDPVTARAVHAGIDRLTEGRTVVMVTHRMQSIRHADTVALLADGRIVEHGMHDELLHSGGRYAAFWKAAAGPAPGHRP